MGFLSVKSGLKGPEVRTPLPPDLPLAGSPVRLTQACFNYYVPQTYLLALLPSLLVVIVLQDRVPQPLVLLVLVFPLSSPT